MRESQGKIDVFLFRFFTLGLFDSWGELTEKIPRFLVWTLIIIPFVGAVALNVNIDRTPFGAILNVFVSPARRIKDAGIEGTKSYTESVNNLISGEGMRPGSVSNQEEDGVQ